MMSLLTTFEAKKHILRDWLLKLKLAEHQSQTSLPGSSLSKSLAGILKI